MKINRTPNEHKPNTEHITKEIYSIANHIDIPTLNEIRDFYTTQFVEFTDIKLEIDGQ